MRPRASSCHEQANGEQPNPPDQDRPGFAAVPEQNAMSATDWDRLPMLFPLLPLTAEITGMGSSYLREAARAGWLRPAVVRFGRSIRIQRSWRASVSRSRRTFSRSPSQASPGGESMRMRRSASASWTAGA
jgi:hypothetical protein